MYLQNSMQIHQTV